MNDPDRQIWDEMLAHLRKHHASLCRQWFEELEPLGVDNGTLTLRAHSTIHRDYLKRQCFDAFNDAARAVTGHFISVRFIGPETESAPSTRRETAVSSNGGAKANAETTSTAAWSNAAGPDALTINPDYDFGNFVIGPGNRLAHAAAVAVAENPGRAYNPLFIHGGVGLGKTHLLQAICLRIRETAPDAVIQYISCDAFMTEFFAALQAGRMNDFRHHFRDSDVLVIDDIHFLASRDQSQEEFFHTFNTLYHASRQIIVSSDAPPEEIPNLENRLVSRFKWGLVTLVEPPCYETRVAIVKTKARLRGLDLPDEVACHVAAQIDTNIRELEGAVTRIQIQSMVENAAIDIDLTRKALGDRPAATNEVSIQGIIDAVAEHYGVRVTELQSKRRPRSIALPRQVCMYLARQHTRHSLKEIGGYFGGRDHTTVMHAVKAVESRLGDDVEFKRVLAALDQRVRNNRAQAVAARKRPRD